MHIFRGEANLRPRQGSHHTLFICDYIWMHVFFLNNLSGHTLKTDFVRKSYAYFSEYCVKPASNRKQELGIRNIDSFSRFNVNNIAWLVDIYHEPYYIQDNIKLFVIHAWRIIGFKDFLIFEKHIMFPPTILSAQWIGFSFTSDDKIYFRPSCTSNERCLKLLIYRIKTYFFPTKGKRFAIQMTIWYVRKF
jgi:hypothetical protein